MVTSILTYCVNGFIQFAARIEDVSWFFGLAQRAFALFDQSLRLMNLDPKVASAKRIFVPLGALLCALWIITLGNAWWQYRELISKERARLESICSTIAENVDGVLVLTKLMLDTVNGWLEQHPDVAVSDSLELRNIIQDLVKASAGGIELNIVDQEGRVLTAVDSDGHPFDVRDRDYFKAYKDSKLGQQFVGAPVQGKVSRQWVIPIAVPTKGGLNAVMMVAGLKLSRLTYLKSDALFSDTAGISILRGDGMLLARVPDRPELLGKMMNTSYGYLNYYTKMEHGSFFVEKAFTDQLKRLAAFQNLSRLPINIVIGEQYDEIVEPWIKSTIVNCSILFVITILFIVFALKFHRNLQSLVRSTHQAEENRALLRVVFDNLPFECWAMDGHGLVTFQNNISLARLGDQIGKTFSYRSGDLANTPEADNRLLTAARGQPVRTEIESTVDGERAYFMEMLLPVKTDQERFGVVAVKMDITDSKRLLQETRKRIEHEAQLGKMESLGKMAGGIAHDFNNLLGAILGYATFLKQNLKEKDKEGAEFAAKIITAGERGQVLISKIMGFSRQSQRMPALFSVNAMVMEVIDQFRSGLPAGLSVSLDMSDRDIAIVGDFSQLHRAVMNLCTNAKDACDPTGGKIMVKVELRDISADDIPFAKDADLEGTTAFARLTGQSREDGSFVAVTGRFHVRQCISIRVSNTGEGIAENVRDSLFEPFFTTKRWGGGTGYGLPLVKSAMDEHEGGIIVSSRTGEGASFELVIPWHGLTCPVPEPKEELPRVRALVPATILLIDDDLDFCQMLETAVCRFGHKVVAINDPIEAVRMFRESQTNWDMVITDQSMPGMRGVEVVRTIKKLQPSVICLLGTGNWSETNEEQALAAGADAFFTKPVNLAELERRICGLLETKIPA